jgi:hypothetical protein
MGKEATGDTGKVTAVCYGPTHNKHPEQEDHYIEIDRPESIGRSDLPGEEDCDGSPEHDLPDADGEPADLPHRDEEEDDSKDDDRDVRDQGREYRKIGVGMREGTILANINP